MNKQERELVKKLENEFGKENIVIKDNKIKVLGDGNKFGIFGDIISGYIKTSNIKYQFGYEDKKLDCLGDELDDLIEQELKCRAVHKTKAKI